MRARHQTYRGTLDGSEVRAPLPQPKRFSRHHQPVGGGSGCSRTASALSASAAPEAGEKPASPGTLRKIPIGVFDPAFPNLSSDELIDKCASWEWRRWRSGLAAIPIQLTVR